METVIFPDLPLDSEALISFHFEDISFDFPSENQVAAWLLAAAEQEGKRVETVDYIFCTDEYLHKINLDYLQHDDYTDVITFPYSETTIHGDVFISIERVRENAATVGVSFEHELCRVLVHGLLHLAGHTDKTNELRAAMTAKEDFYLVRLSL